MARIRIVLADDHAVLRAGLRALLLAQPDLEVVGEAADGDSAEREVAKKRPDVLILDLTMPGDGGLRVMERIRQASPATRVLVLTMHDVPAYVRAALSAGAAGYVVKRAADTELLAAIRQVHRGRTVLDPLLATSLVQRAVPRRPVPGEGMAEQGQGQLSPREREVLERIARGHTNQEIADQLGLSVKTVETYRSRLVDKLGLQSRADLVRYALDVGLLDPKGGDGGPA